MKPQPGAGAHPAVSAPESDAAGALTGQASRTCGSYTHLRVIFTNVSGWVTTVCARCGVFPAREAPGAPALPGRRSGHLACVSAEQCFGTGPWYRRVIQSSVCPPSQNASFPPEAPTASPVPWLSQRCRHTGDAYLCVFAQLYIWMCFSVLLAFELYKTGVTV